MFRENKTRLKYKNGYLEIRKAHVGEEYEIGNWANTYDLTKLGYCNMDVLEKYSDIIYVMTYKNSIIGYFMAYNLINTGNNPNIPLYSKELVLYDFAVFVRAYAKYSKILIDFMIKYANISGYKAISFVNINKHTFFHEFMKRHYNVVEIEDKYYIFNENPRIKSYEKHLQIYEGDKVSIEDLYFMYDLNFNVCKSKCYLNLQNKERIEVDRKTGIISFPSNVKIKNDNVVINSVTRNILELVISKYHSNQIEEVLVDFDLNHSFHYEVYMDELLHISKTHSELIKDVDYKNKLIERGFDRVVPNQLKYNMNEQSFLYVYGIIKL